MRVFLAALVLIFSLQSWTRADDIRDFEIAGMSIGDSLLEYYTESKLMLTETVKNRENIITVYPFNFNSKFRSETFLFGKIFDSIINRKKIEIGSTYYYRDILHAKYVASLLRTSIALVLNGISIPVSWQATVFCEDEGQSTVDL